MDPRLDSRGSNDLGGAMFKGEHIRVHIQACPFWKSRLFDLTKGGEKKQEREDHLSYAKGFTKLRDKGQDAS
jgi:hypothetical protein